MSLQSRRNNPELLHHAHFTDATSGSAGHQPVEKGGVAGDRLLHGPRFHPPDAQHVTNPAPPRSRAGKRETRTRATHKETPNSSCWSAASFW
eukprot:1289123-Rhodomonas_salina.1